LAIDINGHANPHVVGGDVIGIFNSVARLAGVSFDFGRFGTEAVRKKKYSDFTPADVRELYERAKPASDAMRDWLRKYLPEYRRLISQVEASEKGLGVKKAKTTASLEARLKAAEDARDKLKKQLETKTRQSVTSIPQDTFLESMKLAIAAIVSNVDLRQIQILYEHFEHEYIDTWELRGVLNLPLFLVAAMVSRLHLKWGEQYKESKDAMHFELLDARGKARVTAENPLGDNEPPRTLARLVSRAFSQGSIKWKLVSPTLLANLLREW
jgi:hypothetical protein